MEPKQIDKSFHAALAVSEILAKLRTISQRDLPEALETIPKPSQDEYCKYMLEWQREKDRSLKYCVLFKLKSDEQLIGEFMRQYSQFVNDFNAINNFYQKKHDNLFHQYTRNRQIEEIRESHTDKDLIQVLEILVNRRIYEDDLPEILEALPKPTEEEYCKHQLERDRLYEDDAWYVKKSDEELKVEFKRRYQQFIKDFRAIRRWYEHKEVVQQSKARHDRHIEEIRQKLISKNVPENELDQRIQDRLDEEYEQFRRKLDDAPAPYVYFDQRLWDDWESHRG